MAQTTLVSTAWLAENINKQGVVVFDTTKYLPNEPKDGLTEFAVAHIPGARFFDIDAIADSDTDLPHMVPTPGRFAKMIGDLGVSNDSFVVFYDQKGLASAARGWWMMGLYGHDSAAVLDGGLPKWVAEGRRTEAGAPSVAKRVAFRPDFRPTRLRGIGDMLANVMSHKEVVLDARPGNRFRAEVPEPRAGMRSGHMPGAVSLPATELLAADQTLLPPEALRAKLAAVGIDGSRPVVTSCGSGVTATILTLAMKHAGLPEGAVYDGSWTEWGGRPDTPVETGP
jgi:thiosulfate/3-mercaptopyruvate sulfurtransferase